MGRIEQRFRLAHEPNLGVCCDEGGLSVGGVPLFVRAGILGGGRVWRTLSAEEINEALGAVYGLPVDVASKVGGLARVADALDRDDIARAQILTLHLHFPDPPDLSKAAGNPRLFNDLAARLQASGLLKADWDPAKHPRWPASSPDSVGGQFAPAGDADGETPGGAGEADHVVARFRDGPPKFVAYAGRADTELSDGVYRHPVGAPGDVSEFDVTDSVFGPPKIPQFKPDLIGDIAEITANAADRQAIGKAGEAAAEEAIIASGYKILGDQVHVRDQFGQLRVIDFIVGKQNDPTVLAAIEVKANSGRRTERQRIIDLNIEISGGTIVSKRPLRGGLTYGKKIYPHTSVLEVDVAYP